MKKIITLLVCLLLSGCTFYSINVSVLSPNDEGVLPKDCKAENIDVSVVIKDNNDADSTKGADDISAIPK